MEEVEGEVILKVAFSGGGATVVLTPSSSVLPTAPPAADPAGDFPEEEA